MYEPHSAFGRYHTVKKLGQGSFGIVHCCKDKLTNEYFAVKTIPWDGLSNSGLWPAREMEISMHLSFKHRNVMPLFLVYCTELSHEASYRDACAKFRDHLWCDLRGEIPALSHLHIHMMSEYCQSIADRHVPYDVHLVMPLQHGDLFHLLQQQHQLAEPRSLRQAKIAVTIAFQLVFAMDFLHKCNIVHRDLKSQNLLLHFGASEDEVMLIVGDYGLARNQLPQQGTDYVCTLPYRAPEIILRQNTADSSMDVWSIGCILYEICTHKVLFGGVRHSQRVRLLASAQLLDIIDIIGSPNQSSVMRHAMSDKLREKLITHQCSSKIANLVRENFVLVHMAASDEVDDWIDAISACLAFFPSDRPSAQELASYRLFQRYGFRYGEGSHIQSTATTYNPTSATSFAGGYDQNTFLAASQFTTSAVVRMVANYIRSLVLVSNCDDETRDPITTEPDDEVGMSRASSCASTVMVGSRQSSVVMVPLGSAEDFARPLQQPTLGPDCESIGFDQLETEEDRSHALAEVDQMMETNPSSEHHQARQWLLTLHQATTVEWNTDQVYVEDDLE